MTTGVRRLLTLTALLALVALAGSGAAASAKTVSYNNIVSPSKLIYCYAVIQSTRIECHAPYLKDIGELDTFLALSPRGRARYGERGDFPGHTTPRRTLHYGDTWKRTGIRCTIQTTGLTCRNRDNHGFHIAKGDVRRF
jgi:hypothetical protein